MLTERLTFASRQDSCCEECSSVRIAMWKRREKCVCVWEKKRAVQLHSWAAFAIWCTPNVYEGIQHVELSPVVWGTEPGVVPDCSLQTQIAVLVLLLLEMSVSVKVLFSRSLMYWQQFYKLVKKTLHSCLACLFLLQYVPLKVPGNSSWAFSKK